VSRLIVAAGGLLLDETRGVLLVHRPRHDDWSLPKGKAEPGEPLLACALREVTEETGLEPRALAPLGATRYALPDGAAKVVVWFLMVPRLADGARPDGREVDEVAWESPAAALQRLTYPTEQAVLRRLEDEVLVLA